MKKMKKKNKFSEKWNEKLPRKCCLLFKKKITVNRLFS